LEELGVTGARKTLFFRLLELFKFAGSQSATTRITVDHLGIIFSASLMDLSQPDTIITDTYFQDFESAKAFLVFLINNADQVKACAYSEQTKRLL